MTGWGGGPRGDRHEVLSRHHDVINDGFVVVDESLSRLWGCDGGW